MEPSIGGSSSWRPPKRTSAKEPAQVTGAEIESALSAAERLAAEADRAEHEVTTTRFWAGLAAAVLLALAALTLGTLTGHVGTTGFRILAAVATVILLASAASCSWLFSRAEQTRKSAALKLSLAQGIAGTVREVMLEVAEREKWSYIRLEATRLRVSAFPPSTVSISQARRGRLR